MFPQRLNKLSRNVFLHTWGLCCLHWAPQPLHGESPFGALSLEGLVVVGCVHSPKPRTLGWGWLVVSFCTCPNKYLLNWKKEEGARPFSALGWIEIFS